jgi:parallel beta-helix repeat protein
MKTLFSLFTSLLVLLIFSAQGQTVVFSEDFEGTPPYNLTSSSPGTADWAISSNYQAGGLYSDTSVVVLGDTAYLTSNSFSTTGNSFVVLEFSHICKINFSDAAEIEVSIDGGTTWSKLDGNHYLGSSNFVAQGNKFNAGSYSLWEIASPTTINNSWWKREKFDISPIAANQADVRVRFVLRDGNNQGAQNYLGWFVDDIDVTVQSELHDLSVDRIVSPTGNFCYGGNEYVSIVIANQGYDAINGGFTASYTIDGGTPVTENVSSTIGINDSITYTFPTPINFTLLGQDSTVTIKTYVNAPLDPYQTNDSLETDVTFLYVPPAPTAVDDNITYGNTATLGATSPNPIKWYETASSTTVLDTGATFTTPVLYGDKSYFATAESGTGVGGIITEICQYAGSSTGEPVGGQPSFLGDDYIEITGAPGADISGYSFEKWTSSGTSPNVTHTFPAGTVLNAEGTYLLSTYQGTTSLGDYHQVADVTSSYGSTSASLNVFKNPQGEIVDVVLYDDGTTIPSAAGITNEWTGAGIDGSSSWGIRLEGPDTDDNTNWVKATQDPNILNTGVEPPSLGCESPRTEVWAYVTGNPPVDAGVTEITEPVSPTNLQNQNVVVSIQNFGSNNLTSATVNWSINGTPQTPFSWSGNLSTSALDTFVIGTFTPSMGNNFIEAWTSSPNGVADPMVSNDSASSLVEAFEPLCGTYTIGGASADFVTFDEAIYALDFSGVSCAVTFLVNPGTYNEQIVLSDVVGASATNTITFRSASGNPADVELTYAGTTAANYVVKMDDAKYINFKKMTFSATDASYARVFEFNDSANYNVIDSCILNSVVVSTTSSDFAIIYKGSGGHAEYNTFSNNTFNDGSSGLYYYGSGTTSLSAGILVENNNFNEQYYAGAYLYYLNAPIINNNVVYSNSSYTSFYGISAAYCDNALEITKNTIEHSQSGYGIRVYYSDGTPSAKGLIANNMVSYYNGTGTLYGVYHYYSTYQDYYHNSIQVEGTGASTRALYMYGSTTTTIDNVNMKNNIFENIGSVGQAIYTSAANTFSNWDSDYNNIYAPNTDFAYYNSTTYTDLAAWQTATSQDANSVSLDPGFISNSDLHVIGPNMNEVGTPIAIVTDDIDGDLRSATVPDIGADEYELAANDAGIMALVEPLSPCAGMPSDVVVNLMNLGTATLNTVTIDWEVNGVAQTPFNYNASLASGSDTNIVLGTYTFNPNILYSIKAWSSNPNGSVDPNTWNDTTLVNGITTSMNGGIYTINPALPASATNFVSFQDALDTLNLKGICASVIIEVASGTYNEQLVINEIPGTHAGATVTFRSATGNASSVNLTNDTTTSSTNYTVYMNGAKYISFKNMTISATDASYARVFEFANSADYNTIDSCIITGVNAGSTSTNFALIYKTSSAGQAEYNTFSNNTFNDGSYGMYYYGSGSTALGSGILIENNNFLEQYYSGIYLYYLDAPVINKNTVISNSSYTLFYGISARYCDNALEITKNTVEHSQSGYGISVYYSDGTPSAKGLIANNMVSYYNGTSTLYGIYHYYSAYQDYYYNSIRVEGSSTSTRPLYMYGSTTTLLDNITMKNNIFANTGNSGYGIYTSTPTTFSNWDSDYNNIYAPNVTFAYHGATIADLAAWQTATSQDANSVSIDPGFISNSNLHIFGANMNEIGTPIASVIDDIDGDPRSATVPDIGADEYEVVDDDAGITALVHPIAPCSGTPTDVIVNLMNFGQDTLFSATIDWEVNGIAQSGTNYSGSLASGNDTNIVIGSYTFNSGTVYDIKAWSSNPNGVLDVVNWNDTVMVTGITTAMDGGVFTIDPALPASSTNFISFQDALDTMNYYGICSSIIFDVASGTYNEQLQINNIPGSSSFATITFRSATGNPADVNLTYAPTSSTANYTVNMDGAQYVTFKQMTISSTGTSYSRVLDYTANASYNTIDSCVIRGAATSTSTNYALVYSSSNNPSYNTFSNSTFSDGSYGFYFYGSGSSSLAEGNVVDNNTFDSQYYAGIRLYYQSSPSITNNKVTSSTSYSTFYGIYAGYCDNTPNISGNNVLMDVPGYGLYVYYCDGDTANPGQIVNNMVNLTASSGTAYGIYSYYSYQQEYYYNTAAVQSSSGYAFRLYGSTATIFNLHYENNNFVAPSGAYAVYYGSATYPGITADYNNYYSSSAFGYYGTDISDLATWQAATAMDGNSLNSEPTFVSVSDLHVISGDINGMANPNHILVDIDGDVRNVSSPDMGADEFDPPAKEAVLFAATSPIQQCGLGQEAVTLEVKNNGTDDITSIDLTYISNTATPVTETYNPATPVPLGDTLTYTFTQLLDMTPPAVDSTFNLTFYISLAGDTFNHNDTLFTSIVSKPSAQDPIVTNVTIPYGTTATLTAVGGNPVDTTFKWYDVPFGGNALHTGNPFITPVLYDTTVYWVEAYSGGGSATPELIYYDFDTPGTTVPNLATTPVGTNPAPMTGVTIGGTGLSGTALVGTGGSSSSHAVNTGWNTNLNGSFTISFWTSDITPSGTLWYIWGDAGAGSFRCFTNGVAGANNWLVRGGGLPDLEVTGGATVNPNVIHVVYDAPAGTYKAYVDGVLVNTVTAPTSNTMSGSGFTVGGYSSSSGLSGLMDEFRVYDRALSDSEILLSLSGVGGCPSARVADTVFVPVAQIDLGVVSIDEPITSILKSANEDVSVTIQNFGTDPVSNFDVSFTFDGGSPITETIAGPIAPGTTMTHTFATTVDMSTEASYDFVAYTTILNDASVLNDTAYATVDHMPFIGCPSGATSSTYTDIGNVTIANLNNGNASPILNNNNATNDYSDFTQSVPAVWLAPGQTYPISVTQIEPATSFNASLCNIYIDLNRDGDLDPITELVYSGSTISETLPTTSGNITIPAMAQQGYTLMRVVLDRYDVAPPCGTYSYGETEDYTAIIAPIIAQDAGVIGFTSPDPIESAETVLPVEVMVKNFGSTDITSMDVLFTYNGSAPVSQAWTGTLNPGDTAYLTLSDITIVDGSNNLCAWTDLIGDSNSFNDEYCMSILGLPPVLLFEDDMEFGSLMIDTASTLWERGVPNGTVINSAHSPDTAWVTGLSSQYTANVEERLYTSKMSFLMVSGAYLSLWHWVDAESGADGGHIEYTDNDGSTWKVLGTVGDTKGINWYEGLSSAGVGWTNPTNGWTYAIYDLSDLDNNIQPVQFRFVFNSDGDATVADGWALDDIKIHVPRYAIDAGVTDIIAPSGSTVMGTQTPVTVKIKNFGSDTLTSINLGYRINTGYPPQSATWNGTLAPDSTVDYTFNNQYPGPNQNYTLCAYTQMSQDANKTNDTTCVNLSYDTGIEEIADNGLILRQNMPNPAAAFTEISYFLPYAGNIRFTVTDVLGNLLYEKDENKGSGNHKLLLQTESFATGVYFYSVEFDNRKLTMKMIVR